MTFFMKFRGLSLLAVKDITEQLLQSLILLEGLFRN